MEKPTLEFFATLGQYVYQYIDQDGKVYYTGKGNGDRCWAHVGDKDYNPKDIYIIAKNLERFEGKKDWQSLLLESFLIATQNPEGNCVSGHYKECFVMASLSSMFSDFQNDQHDNFESLPEWYVENYDVFRNKLREIKIWKESIFIMSNARNSINMMWYWYSGNETPIKVTFEVNKGEGDELSAVQANLKKWLASEGYKKPRADGKIQKIAIDCDNIDSVIKLFIAFNS